MTTRKEQSQEERRLYLVAIPQGEVRDCALRLQSMFNKKYQLYHNPPPVHLTLEVIEVPKEGSEREALELISGVTENSPPIEIGVEGLVAFPSPYKNIAIKVVKNPALRSLAAQLNNRLAANGFGVRSDLSSWDYHITVAGTWNATKEWSTHEFEQAYRRVKRLNVKGSFRIPHLELWLPQYQPRLAVMAWFPLLGKASEVKKERDQLEFTIK